MNEVVSRALVKAILPPTSSQAEELVPEDLERNWVEPTFNFEEFRRKTAAVLGVDLSEEDDIVF
jgi:hypothetical protein